MTSRGSVLVTGGGSGLGSATAVLLGELGYDVHVAGRTVENLAAVVATIAGRGGRAHAHELDVRDADACERVVDEVVRLSGRIDVLVNNAGLFRRGSVTQATSEDWNLTIDTNLTGAFYAARAAAVRMREQEPRDGCRGHILNVNSGAGLRGYAVGAAYTASKFGLMGLSDALRQEVSVDLVKVTDVVVATAVRSNLSSRTGVRRLPAESVAQMIAGVLAMPGAAVITRVDLEQLPEG
ncbi:MAG: SDR family oxidoreductase [Micromonosporaceae bacterium]|nr:SDR family oxidoreductase [Micromonosporaceae bacterium]